MCILIINWHLLYSWHKNNLEPIQRNIFKNLAFKMDALYQPRGINQNILLHRFQEPLQQKRNFRVTRYVSIYKPTFQIYTPRSNIYMQSSIFHLCFNSNLLCQQFLFNIIKHLQCYPINISCNRLYLPII